MPDSDKQHLKETNSVEKSDPFSVEIGKRLVEARTGLGLSQQAVHTRTKQTDPAGVGVSRAVLSLYETGVNKPGAREIRILCETLKVTPNWLLYGTESPVEALQPSMEFLHGPEVVLSVRLAYALLALSPTDRGAIANIIFSLANKKLSDTQLSSLMMMANYFASDFLTKEVFKVVGNEAGNLPMIEVIEKFVANMGEQFYTNWGTLRPAVPENELNEFDPDNPPPPRKLS